MSDKDKNRICCAAAIGATALFVGKFVLEDPREFKGFAKSAFGGGLRGARFGPIGLVAGATLGVTAAYVATYHGDAILDQICGEN